MARAGAIALLSVCISGTTAFSQTVSFDIIIAQNVDRGRNHYAAAAAEANRILQRCTGMTAELAAVRRFTNSIGVAPITEESTRAAARTSATTNGANILAVNDLRVCGSLRDANVVGCAAQGSALTIETSNDPRQEGRIIAHELGHSSDLMGGLTGQAHVSESGFLMYRAIEMSVARPAIADEQCSFFKNVPARFEGPSGVVGPDAILLADADANTGGDTGSGNIIPTITSDLDQVLEQVWMEGPPFAELDELMQADDALAKLRIEVVSGANLLKRTNAATALGRYGAPGDIQILLGALTISRPGDDSAELQRFSSAAIGSIAELGIRHNDPSAANAIRDILAEAIAGRSTNLPTDGKNRSDEIDIMSSAATTALEVSSALEEAGLIASTEALVNNEPPDSTGPVNRNARDILAESLLNLDPAFVERVLSQ